MTTVLARARVVIEGDTVQIDAAMNRAEGRLRQAGQRMTEIGRELTAKVTLPILGVGGAATAMAASYDESMRKIVALTDTSREQMEAWRGQVRELAVELGRAPAEAAEALFFITSAGIKGESAMEALRASLTGAAIGLGDTKSVADAATSAMNAYAKTGLTATRATEILAAAVKFGKIEATAVAPVMGRLTGTAAALGISFADLAGTLAVFSRTGTQAAEGATQINAIMSTLLGTSEEGEKVLLAAGLSLEELRKVATGPRGLVNVMRILDARLTLPQLRVVIPNIRAFRGVMNALAQDADVVNEVLDGTMDSIGFLATALHESEGPAHALRVAWARIKDAFIEAGDVLIPVTVPAITALSRAVQDAARAFSGLPPQVRQGIIVAAAFAAALGPALLIVGSLTKAVAAIKLVGLLGGLGKLGAVLAVGGPVLVGVAALAALFVQTRIEVARVEAATKSATEKVNEFLETLKPEAAIRTATLLQFRIEALEDEFTALRDRAAILQQSQLDVATGMQLGKMQADELAEALVRQSVEVRDGIVHWRSQQQVLLRSAQSQREATAATRESNVEGGRAASWMTAAKEATDALATGLRQVTQMEGLLGIQFDETRASAELYEEAVKALIAANALIDPQTGRVREQFRELVNTFLDLRSKTKAAEEAQRSYEDAVQTATHATGLAVGPARQYLLTVQALHGLFLIGKISQGTFTAAVEHARDTFQDATERAEQLRQGIQNTASQGIDAMVDFALTGKQAMADFVLSALRDLARLVVRMQLMRVLFPKAGIETTPGAKHLQGGGFLEPGRLGLVGEQGPELIMAGRRGVAVAPVAADVGEGGGERLTVPVTINVTAADARDAQRFFEENEGLISNVMLRALQRTTAFRRHLGSG